MKKRLVTITLVIISILILAVFLYFYRQIFKADVTTVTTGSVSDQIPKAVTFLGHIAVSGTQPQNIYIVINGRAFQTGRDGNFVALVSRNMFLDSSNKTLPAIPVSFWDLSRNIRYQDSAVHEGVDLTLPAEWREGVWSRASTISYVPSAAFRVQRDFNLIPIQE